MSVLNSIFVVSGHIIVEEWTLLSKSVCTIITGLTFPGLVPDWGSKFANHTSYFFICSFNKKIYFQNLISKNFLVPEIEEFYPKKDYPRMFVGEIKEIFIKGNGRKK